MADYKAIKLIKNWVEYCFHSWWSSYDWPRLDIFLLWWWGGWWWVGQTNSNCYWCSWWWGAWEFVIYYWAEVSLWEHTIVVWAWWAWWAANANGWKWWCSCFDDKRADWWWYGAGWYYNWSNNGWCSHWSWWGRSWWRCYMVGCQWLWNTSNARSFAWWGAGWDATYNGSTFEWWSGKTTDFTWVYKIYWCGGYTTAIWCCYPRDANTWDGGLGSCQCNCPWWAWGSWFIAVRYPIDWSYCISSSTWWTCSQVNICWTCYCVHCFTSSWTLTIS